MKEYYSDRERGPRARVNDEITNTVWGGIYTIIQSRISDGSFGKSFPEECPDGGAVCGTDEYKFELALKAEIPDIEWPFNAHRIPPTFAVLDLIEFCFNTVAESEKIGYHSFFRHNHYNYDVEKGQISFRDDVNRIFARNGIAYELKSNGEIQRLLPPELEQAVISTRFNTGDNELNELLESARKKFLDKEPQIRKESLEKLWDAWERLKTLEPGNKKNSTKLLLDKAASEPHLRGRIEIEATELTAIGNDFRIRHSETDKISIDRDEDVEYLFYRMFSLILLILKTTGRVR